MMIELFSLNALQATYEFLGDNNNQNPWKSIEQIFMSFGYYYHLQRAKSQSIERQLMRNQQWEDWYCTISMRPTWIIPF